jgi:hypothetical protein
MTVGRDHVLWMNNPGPDKGVTNLIAVAPRLL